MEWLAALSVDRVLEIAFAIALVRLCMTLFRSRIGVDRDHDVGEFIESILFAWVLVFLIVRPLLYEPFSIPSASMRNTLLEGDRIVVNKFIYRFRSPERGDVVVFKSPPAADKDQVDFVKRLIGLPGDTIDFRHGKVVLNGKPLVEPYAMEPIYGPPYNRGDGVPQPPYHVPPGRYFMMGDNRNDSLDSRYWGYLDGSRIKGKVVSIFWPLKRVRSLNQPDIGTREG